MIRYWRRRRADDRKRANLLAGTLARVVQGPTQSKPPRSLAWSTMVACFFDCVFDCVGVSDVVLDFVCLDYYSNSNNSDL